jgi:hypothetical protein
MIWQAVTSLFTGWIDMKKTKYEAEGKRAIALAETEANWDLEALRQSKDSWKDEIFLYVFLSPLVIAWFDEETAMDWINFVTGLPSWYQFMLVGMMSAVFGLRWYVKGQQLNKIKGFKHE